MPDLSRRAAARFRGEHLGFVFQDFNLIPVLSAAENIEYPLLMVQGRPAAERRERVRSGPANAWLLGLRYLTDFELTTIAEVYVDEAGYSREELEAFFRFVDQGDAADLNLAASPALGPYRRPNVGQRYGYLRLSQKDPFDWLYVAPAATAIVNLDDDSRTLIAELGYTGITNIELRGRVMWLQGARFSEFAEKPNARKAELRARWSFLATRRAARTARPRLWERSRFHRRGAIGG